MTPFLIFGDFLKALSQIFDRRFRRVLWLGLGLTLGLLVAFYAGFLWLLNWIDPASLNLPFLGPNAFVGGLLSAGSIGLMLALSIFLMVPVASAITSLFLEDVAAAVEEEHYPHLPPLGRVTFWDGLRDSVNFLGVILLANLLALLVLPVFWFVAPLVWWAMNGYLLGREYFTLAAMRREGREGARQLYRENAGQVWLAGIFLAMPLSVPLVNLFMPILGAATFTHLYHRIAGTAD